MTRLSRTPVAASAAAVLLLASISSSALAGPHGHKGPHRGPSPEKLLARFDSNQDGQISQAEIDAATAAKAQAIDSNGDGLISAAEVEAQREARRRQRQEERLLRADANGDGQVSLDEFSQHQRDRLSRLDRDGDGLISSEELRPPRGPRPPAPEEAE